MKKLGVGLSITASLLLVVLASIHLQVSPQSGQAAPAVTPCTPPAADFTWQGVNLTVTFTNTTSGTPPLSYIWNFGDGTTATTLSPTHLYSQPGTYVTTLIATNACGGDSANQTITITTGTRSTVFLPAMAHAYWPAPTRLPSPSPAITNTPRPPTRSPTPTPTPLPSSTPGGPTLAPTLTRPPTPSPTAVPRFWAAKALTPEYAYPGDTVRFFIGLYNTTATAGTGTLVDMLPSELQFVSASPLAGCSSGTVTLQGQQVTISNLNLPPYTVCQVIITTSVTNGCGCYRTNTVQWLAIWPGGGMTGEATSQPVFLAPYPTMTVPGGAP